ncbi:hypothetical protein A2T76_17100 [Pseudomonas brenneri]|nr:hypothetical protein A2T76_17100 [Pseudomonas brenneri]
MQVHRFLAVDQQVKASGDVQQHLFHWHVVRQLEIHHRQLCFALGFDGGGEQRFLVGEVAVDRQFRHASLNGHGIHAGTRVTIAQKQDFRRVEDCLAFCHVLGTPGAIGVYRIVGHFHFNTGLVSLVLITYWPV